MNTLAHPTKFALVTIALALPVAAAEVWLALDTLPTMPPAFWLGVSVPILAGPLVFLALLSWRRRSHPGRSRLLLGVTVFVALAGLGVLGYDVATLTTEEARRDTPRYGLMALPVIQWLTVLVVWLGLVFVEAREKRRMTATT